MTGVALATAGSAPAVGSRLPCRRDTASIACAVIAIAGGLAGGNFGSLQNSSTSSRIDVTDGYNQIQRQLVGVNYGQVRA